MARSGYAITTGSAITLSTSAKTILGVKSGATTANHGVDLKKIRVAFNGTSASAVPVLVEVCLASWASNAPGTNSTSVTVQQAYGRLAGTGFTAARNWTAEPTILAPIDEWLLTPNGGLVLYDWPLGDTPDSPLGEGFAIRVTAPAAVDVRASMWFERA